MYQVLDLVFSIIPSTEIAGTFKMKLWTWEFYAGSLFMTIAILSVDVGLNYFIKQYWENKIRNAVKLKEADI